MSEKELIKKDLEEAANQQRAEQLLNLERYHYLKEHGYILFETITGSQAHGTNTPTSDIDKAFVYILPEEDILGIRYKEQLKIHKDFMGYEIRRFLELLRTANPTVLELLNSPIDCILMKNHAFDLLLAQKDRFVTKECENSFYGYARQQRTKAEGLEKLQNWEMNRVTKKGPIDFCNVPIGYGFKPVTEWLANQGLDQMFCGLAAVDHCRDLYAAFYDHEAHKTFSQSIPEAEREEYKAARKAAGETMGFGYKGIAFEDSNDIRLSNIPKEERITGFLCHVSYNKDGYAKHCKDYKKYQDWLINRNENRWVEIKGHGQQIDGKNMMHFMRLVNIGREIAEGKGIQIRRPDAQELLKIRRGEVSLMEMFEKSDIILNEMKSLFQNSTLEDEVPMKFIHDLLVDIRTSFYQDLRNGYRKPKDLSYMNSFMLKSFGELSELDFLIKQKLIEKLDAGSNLEELTIMDALDYKSKNWPMTTNYITKKPEKVKIQKLRILKISRDKILVVSGGGDQQLIEFDIVVWGEELTAINVFTVDSRMDETITQQDYFKHLELKVNERSTN